MPAAYPTLKVQVAFANNPNDSNLTWTDITAWARTVRTVRGRTRLLRSMAQFEAGTCAVQLDNRDRRFDPTNTAGPYYPNVAPEKVIQIGATWQGTFYPVWTGNVDDWPCVWPGMSDGRVDLTATDLFKSLGMLRVLSSGYSQAILAGGPSGYWRLGEPAPAAGQPAPTVAVDASANKVNAGYFGKFSLGVSGALVSDPDTAADFSAGGYLSIPAALSAAAQLNSNTHWAVQFWIKTTQASTTSHPIFQDQGTTSANGPFTIWMTNGQLGFLASEVSGPAVNDGLWHQVTVWATIVTGQGPVLYMAIDGNDWGYTTVPVANSTAPYYTGTPTGALVGGFAGWQGAVDEVAVFVGAAADNFQPIGSQLVWTQASKDYTLASFPAQYTGQRVGQVLDLIGFPAGRRRVDTGRTWCQREATDQSSTKALLYLQRCEQTEQGQLFVGADGYAVFQDRYERSLASNATPVAVVGDGGGGYPVSTTGYHDAVVQSGPGDWWRLRDPVGSATAADVETNPQAAMVSGAVTFGVTGPTGGTAARFDGTSGYITAPAQTAVARSVGIPYSVEVWYRTSVPPTVGTVYPLVWVQASTGGADTQFELAIQTGHLYLSWGGATLQDGAVSNDGAWHHAAATWDGTTLCLYRDGQRVGSSTPGAPSAAQVGGPLILAAMAGNGISAQGFVACDLAELAIYSHALAGSDVSRHYTVGGQAARQGSTEIPYEMGGLTLNFDRGELYNEVPVTRQGGQQQVAQDQASIASYRIRTVIGGLTELLMATDTDALYCAEWILSDTAQPQLRIGDITLDPNTDPRLWPLVLGAEIGNIVTVNKHQIPGGGPAISVNVRIEGIEHSIDPPYQWKTVWHLSKQSTQPWVLLDDPVAGLLDEGNRWGW